MFRKEFAVYTQNTRLCS